MRWLPVGIALALGVGCTGGADSGLDTGSPVAAADALLSEFHLGVNQPWLGYGTDFGVSAWGDYGLAGQPQQVEADLAAIAASGARVVRWFVLTDGRSGVIFDQGVPVGLQDDVFEDLDLLLDVAEAHDLLLVPVLLDFTWLAPEQQVEGVQLGGRADVLRSEVALAGLVDDVLRPILRRYADRPGVLAWDLINEPVWAVQGLGGGWLGDGVELEEMLRYMDASAAAVHQETAHRVTIGCASALTVPLWADVDVDLVQLHAYDDSAFDRNAVDVCGSLPCVIGELGTSADDGDLLDNIQRLADRGYDGVWPWSLRADDDASDLDLDQLAAWWSMQ